MRKLLVFPAVFAIAFGVVAATACGGGGEAATSTVAASPTKASATAGAAAGSPSASPAGQVAGGGAGAPGTGGAGGAPTRVASPGGTRASAETATRHPETVVSTPRRIVTKTPTLGPQATATSPAAATAAATASPDDSGLQILLSQDFSGDAAPFFTGTTDSGVTMAVADGAYSIALPAGYWQTAVSDDSAAPSDGLIIVDVTLGQAGSAGVVARDQINDDGSYAFYACWLEAAGAAGCSLNQNGQWAALFTVDAGTAPLEATNTLIMSVVGGDITFAIGNTIVGSATDTSIPAGYWGMYADSPNDAEATVVFDNIGIAQVPPDYQLGQ